MLWPICGLGIPSFELTMSENEWRVKRDHEIKKGKRVKGECKPENLIHQPRGAVTNSMECKLNYAGWHAAAAAAAA